MAKRQRNFECESKVAYIFMKFKLNFAAIPLIVFWVAAVGGSITSNGVESWYRTLNLPWFTPSGQTISVVWFIIFILSAISVLIVWNKFPRNKKFYWIIALFLLNGVLNIFWSYLFFGIHFVGWSTIEAILLGFSVLSLIILIQPYSKLAGFLLYPYFLWVAFAAYLNYQIWFLN